MANVKISQLPSLTTMTDTAEIPVVSAGVTYQITGANLTNYFSGGNTFSSITMTSTPGGAANNIQYGLGNLFVWNDGGWTIGEYNGTTSGTEGIRINPDIEGPVDVTLPATQVANTTPTSISNFLGNVVVNTGVDYVSHQWKFGNDGNLTLPDGTVLQNPGGIEFPASEGEWDLHSSDGKIYIGALPSSMAYIDTYDANISVRLRTAGNNDWIFDPTGNLVLPDIPNPSINYANGTPYGGGGGANTGNVTFNDINIIGTGNLNLQPDPGNAGAYLDVYLTSGPDIHIAGNGENVIIGRDGTANVTVNTDGNVNIQTWNGSANTWTFGNDGTLTTPGVAGNITGANIISANTFITPGVTIDSLGQITAASNSVVSILANGVNGGFLVDYYGNTNADANTSGGEIALNGGPNVELTIGLSSDSGNGSASRVWRYNTAGQTSFPILTTQRGDSTSGTITGYTLNGGTGDYEFVISTPDGITGIDSSQRLVINPGKGRDGTAGEGGDIYLWAGRGGSAGGSGGDVKIRGGQGMGGGDGGYIRMEAGDGASSGGYPGYIEITGGQGGTGQPGGYVRITAGQGDISGGDANITGGTGIAGPGGTVYITGGVSGNGLAEYGNVHVVAGASSWIFGNDGTLTLPYSATIKTTSDSAIAIGAFAGTGGSSAVSLGYYAGALAQSFDAIAIGGQAGANTQGGGAIAIGGSAGNETQGAGAIAIGPNAGQFGQGTLAIAIGASAGYNVQASSSIVINATGSELNNIVANTLVVAPVRNDVANIGNIMFYNNTSKEITYGNTISVAGNISGGNVIMSGSGGDITMTGGNITGVNSVAATGNANVLTLTTRNGDSNNSNASPQIIMGYGGTGDYPQFIHTTHNASTPVDNNIEFWTSDGTQAGTFPGNAVLGLTVTNGSIKTGGISATGNVLGNGYARFSGSFDESQAATAGIYVGYAGGTPRMMFGTGNTQQTFEIDNDGGTLRFYQPGSTKASLTSQGVFDANVMVTSPKALSSLTAVAGARAFVNDGNLVAAGNFGAQIGGSGSNVVPVWSDGINWYIG